MGLSAETKHDAGIVSRVPAEDIELVLSDAVHSHLKSNSVETSHDIKLRSLEMEPNTAIAKRQNEPQSF
jgi:hypothetical protein